MAPQPWLNRKLTEADRKWAVGPREVMHRGAHMGGGHPRWEMEWVGGVGAGPVHRKMKIFKCVPV